MHIFALIRPILTNVDSVPAVAEMQTLMKRTINPCSCQGSGWGAAASAGQGGWETPSSQLHLPRTTASRTPGQDPGVSYLQGACQRQAGTYLSPSLSFSSKYLSSALNFLFLALPPSFRADLLVKNNLEIHTFKEDASIRLGCIFSFSRLLLPFSFPSFLVQLPSKLLVKVLENPTFLEHASVRLFHSFSLSLSVFISRLFLPVFLSHGLLRSFFRVYLLIFPLSLFLPLYLYENRVFFRFAAEWTR